MTNTLSTSEDPMEIMRQVLPTLTFDALPEHETPPHGVIHWRIAELETGVFRLSALLSLEEGRVVGERLSPALSDKQHFEQCETKVTAVRSSQAFMLDIVAPMEYALRYSAKLKGFEVPAHQYVDPSAPAANSHG